MFSNLKVSHKEPFEVTKFACYSPSIYVKNMTVKCYKVHVYLGMDLDFSEKGSITVLMIKYVRKILQTFPEELRSTSTTPAIDDLFKVRDQDEAKLLSVEQAE